jgi:hypothetical protein
VKRSRAVPLTLVASATSLAACGGKQEPLQCVERGTNRVVAESLCTATNAPTNAAPVPADSTRVARSGGIPPIFLWYYGGRLASGMMSGGGYAPLAGRRYRSASGLAFRQGQGWSRARSVGAPSTVGAGRSNRSSGTVRGGFGGIGAGRSGIGG